MSGLLHNFLKALTEKPDHICIRFYDTDRRQFIEQSHQTLHRAILHWHQQIKKESDTIIPIFGHMHLETIAAWLATLFAGKQPTFISFPNPKITKEDYQEKLNNYQNHFKNHIFIGLDSEKKHVQSLITPKEDTTSITTTLKPNQDPEQPLFIQCSSGTTGLQKAVAITENQLKSQLDQLIASLNINEKDHIISWLPLYHDMGLISSFLLPLFKGIPVTYIDTFEWAANPSLLLEAIAKSKATLCWQPNFAFSFLCKAKNHFDLSSIRAFINCAEPVSYQALQKFSTHHTIQPHQLAISYALAENVFAVSQSTIGEPPKALRLQRKALDQRQIKIDPNFDPSQPIPSDDQEHILLFSCGEILPQVKVKIEYQNPEDQIGEILLKSPCTIDHYLHSHPPREDGWFPTGDLGFIQENQLYIRGRIKDLIIHHGKNIYPQDLEAVVNQYPDIHKGRVSASGVIDQESQTEQILILCEGNRPLPNQNKQQLQKEISHRLKGQFDIQVQTAIVPNMWLKKTSSGKIARHANRDAFLKVQHRTIHIVGDSHVRIFWKDHNTHYNVYKYIQAYWVGTLWADNWPKALPQLLAIISTLPKEDILLIQAGEPECRTTFARAKDPYHRIRQSITGYQQLFTTLQQKSPCPIGFLTGIPTAPFALDHDPAEWPVVGPPQLRYHLQKTFYHKMALLCERMNLPFIDVCTPLIGSDGLIPKAMLFDNTHLDPRFRDIYLRLFEHQFGYINGEAEQREPFKSPWDGTKQHYTILMQKLIQELSPQVTDPDYDHLVSGGVLDSLAVVQLISLLEMLFSAKIELNRVNRNHFDSLEKIYQTFIQ
ncbi:AMP-binding protein [Magnetococcales bacterium HHB-1]